MSVECASRARRSNKRARAAGPIPLLLVLALLLAPAAVLPPVSGSGEGSRDAASWTASSTGLPTNGNYFGVTLADINKDGKLDIVAASESSGVRVYTGDGAGNWSAVAVQPPNTGGSDVRVGDLDKDGNMDIVAGTPGTGGSTNGMHIYKGNGAGSFTEMTAGSGLPTSGTWRGIALGDVNKDGNLDIAATNGYTTSGGIRVFTGNGTGKFANNSTGLPTSGERDSGIVLADFNNDGNLDLAAGGGAGVACYIGNGGSGGTMSWTSSSTGLPSSRLSGVNATDFNKDGMMDLVLGAYNAGSGVGLRAYRNVNNAASWTSCSTRLSTSGDFIDVSTGDFDADGNVDILTAGSYGSTYGIRTFYGDGNGNWNLTNISTTDQWIGSDVADFNGDGAPDFVMGSYSNKGIVAYRNLKVVAPVPAPHLALNAPLGGASWSGGSHRTISWDATNGTPPYNINLSYSTDSGVSFPNDIASNIVQADNGTGTYDWPLPYINSTSVRVLVNLNDARNLTASNSSPSNSEIDSSSPAVTPLLPLDGAQDVSNGTTIRLRFSEGMNRSTATGAVSILGPGTPGLASPSWYGNDLTFQTSGLQMGQRYNVSVSTSAKDDSDPGNQLASEMHFSFNTSSAPIPAVSLDGPTGGEVWLSGSHQSIVWSASGGTGALSVKLEYSTTGASGSWFPIAANEANDGAFDWLVPAAPSTDCYVRVTVTDSHSPPKTASDACDSPFTIKEAPFPLSVDLTSPNGGEVWMIGTLRNITWSSTGGNGQRSASLQYSASGAGGPWTNITANISDTDIYQWLVPNTPATACFMKVTVADGYSPPQKASDVSNSSFTIRAAPQPLGISLASPNGGENWTVATRHIIAWNASGGTAPLRISLEYSTSGRSGPWNPIDSGLGNNGSHQWVVPNTTSSDCYVKVTVTDSDRPPVNTSDVGDSAFAISAPSVDNQGPDVRIVSPLPGRTLKAIVSIGLSATDNVGVTRMELFIDGVSLGIVTSSSATIAWDTTRYSSGQHLLTARAWDAAGNVGVAAPVNVTVNNQKPVPPKEPGFLEKYGIILVAVIILAILAVVLVAALIGRRRPPPTSAYPEAVPAPAQQAFPAAPPPSLYPPPGGTPPPFQR